MYKLGRSDRMAIMMKNSNGYGREPNRTRRYAICLVEFNIVIQSLHSFIRTEIISSLFVVPIHANWAK